MLLQEMTQPEAAEALARGTAVVVTGSVEQHGSHLPLGTDYFAALTIAIRVGSQLGAPVVPVSAVGVAPYHMPWPGSLTLRPRTLIDLIVDVCGGLAAAGVRDVLVVNWHEGNTATIRLAADEAQQSHRVRVVVAETHIITNSLFPDEMEFTHAGSMETAAVLSHNPDLVHVDRVAGGDPVADAGDGHALFRRRDVFPVMVDFRQVAGSGWYGSPHAATAERANEIMDAVADHVVAAFEDVRSQLDERSDRLGGEEGE